MVDRRHLLALPLTLLAGCATRVWDDSAAAPRIGLDFQDKGLSPRNGGLMVTADALRPGDIILSSTNGLNSAGVRLLTLSPVSHASL